MPSGYWQPYGVSTADGPAVTATGGLTCLPVTAKFTIPPNALQINSMFRITAQGRISCVVTTPGTARLDVRLGGTVMFDTGALALNTVAKTTLPWWFDCLIVIRAIGSGTSANGFGFGRFQSEAVVGSPLASTGGSGSLISASASGPETAPAVGAGFDSTVSNTFDMFFTQTVTTGSFTVHNICIEAAGLASL